MHTTRRGFVLILSAPSGAGKSTLVRHLLQGEPGVTVSVSTTTRAPRPGEQEGQDYFYVSQEAFRQRIDAGAFLEWAEVFGNFYGTGREFVTSALADGKVVLMDIDWQGARQVRQSLPADDVVSAFILPPDRDSLEERLVKRGQDDAGVIARRMAKATSEISHWNEYDYLIFNDDLRRAQEELVSLVRAERLRRHRCLSRAGTILAGFGL